MNQKLSLALAGKTLIFDGAMGMELYKKNFFINTSYESLSLTNGKVVKSIHEAYKEAGAEVLTTNSYCANKNKLNKFLMGDKVLEINEAAARLAREVAGEELLVAGSVGPVDAFPEGGSGNTEKAGELLKEQITGLLKGGADFILFESLRKMEDLEAALFAMEFFPETEFITSFALDPNDLASRWSSTLPLWEKAVSSTRKPAALGLNCGLGPAGMLSALEALLPHTTLPVIAQPNSGVPKMVDNRMIYMCSPEYFSTYAVRMFNLGVRGLGGCCGMGPEHIKDMARSIKPLAKAASPLELPPIEKPVITGGKEGEKVTELPPVPQGEKSAFAAKLAAGKWVTNVEITPPQGFHLEKTVANAKLCKDAGFDAVNIPDGPRASSRVSSLVTASRIQQEAGIDCILHVCCRDRNLIGLQAELLGCAALSVNNLLFITGDPPKLGDYPFASGVFDMDSIGMVKVQNRLNRGMDLAGKPIGDVTRALIGVGADPNAIDMKREIRRTQEKIEAGAEFVITQPVFDTEPLLRFIEAVPGLENIPVIAGIWPLASFRNAEFMRNEVPGVVVPDSIMERMAKAATKEEQKAEGIAIAREAIEIIRKKVAGVQVSAPFGNVRTAIEVIS